MPPLISGICLIFKLRYIQRIFFGYILDSELLRWWELKDTPTEIDDFLKLYSRVVMVGTILIFLAGLVIFGLSFLYVKDDKIISKRITKPLNQKVINLINQTGDQNTNKTTNY
jgi:hypothetical protein